MWPIVNASTANLALEVIMHLLARLLINIVAILIISYLFPRVIRVEGFWAALVAAFVLGIINAILRPVLVFFTLPVTILTLGLFLLVINGLLLLLVAHWSRDSRLMAFGELCWDPC